MTLAPSAQTPLASLRRSVGVALALLVPLYVVLVATAPIDSVQGVIQKILYVHPPCAFVAYVGFVTTALGGALYLWRADARFDRLALAGAEMGVLFATLVILTGPIWARGTWGKWWSWDPRLVVTLLQWFVYVAYLLLRSLTEGSERTARFAAVYGIVGALVIPLNYFAIDLFGGRAIHPENLERGSLGAGMGWPFLAGFVTTQAAGVYLVLLRMEVQELRDRAAARLYESER
jgi:heme exporter protein C